MTEMVRAAVKIGAWQSEVREFPMPEVLDDAGLLRVEAAGVCGSDVHAHARAPRGGPSIMGHENVGYIAKLGRIAAERWGLKEGERVLLEEYLPCGHCEWCWSGEHRFCTYRDPAEGGGPRRAYGTAPTPLTGGFAQYMYLRPTTVFHRVPEGVPSELAALGIPFGNGWQWAYLEAGMSPGKTVLIQGPGQQGLGCVVASKEAGASCIIVSGLARDARRLEVARHLGADYTIDVEEEDLRERVREITGGRGVDIVIDAATGGPATVLPAIDLLRLKGTLAVAPTGDRISDFPIDIVKQKYLTVKGVRGHSYRAVEMALRTIASGKYPLQEVTTHRFGLEQVDYAIKSTGGEGAPGAIHVSILPWLQE